MPIIGSSGINERGELLNAAIINLFQKNRFHRIIETGTYLGRGTTQMIANAIRCLAYPAEFISIECNPRFATQARENLQREGLLEYVRMLTGLSLSRESYPGPAQIGAELQSLLSITEQPISADHEESTRAQRYFEECNFLGIEDDLLLRSIKYFGYAPDFILLDSAGHLGFREFQCVVKSVRAACVLALDDVNHIKHIRSLQFMKSDSRFQIIEESDERCGFCIARYTPDATRARARIFYPLPALPRNGGIKVCIQHSHLLNGAGYECYVSTPKEEPSPYPAYSNAKFITNARCLDMVEPTDHFVFCWAGSIEGFVHLQNHFSFFSQGAVNKTDPVPYSRWLNDRFQLITISQHSRNFFLYGHGRDSNIVTNWIDTSVFCPKESSVVANRVGVMKHRHYYDTELIERVRSAGLEVIEILGSENDVATQLQSCQFFLSCSRGVHNGYDLCEGFALPGAEAMACGCVLVTYNNKGCLEYALDKVNSFVSWDTTADGLWRTLLQARTSPDLPLIRNNASHTIRVKFSANVVLCQLVEALHLPQLSPI